MGKESREEEEEREEEWYHLGLCLIVAPLHTLQSIIQDINTYIMFAVSRFKYGSS